MIGLVWENGNVALTEDLILGLCVMSESGWFPLSACDTDTINRIYSLIDHNPSFPKD